VRLVRRLAGARADQRGQAGGVEALAFGALVFISGTLIVANAWAVVDAKFAAVSAAREGAQTYVETGGTAAAAEPPSRLSATAALQSLGRHGTVDVVLGDAYRRCGIVTVHVTTSVPIARVPFVRVAVGRLPIAATATRRIDPYRSGISGGAAC
jgi:hypothetical protein